MNRQFLLIVAALAVYWQITAALIPLEESNEVSERIVRGRTAAEGQFPFAIALEYNGGFVCTASMVSPNYVMTAAHCVVFDNVQQPPELYVAIANVDRTASDQRRSVDLIVVHPEYDASSITNDIAIMRMAEPFEVNDNASPIPLAASGEAENCTGLQIFEDFQELTVMGWGNTVGFPFTRILPANIPKMLQYGSQKSVCLNRCTLAMEKTKICATGDLSIRRRRPTFFSAVCNGDSGGPLVEMSSNGTRQIGITSYGLAIGCGTTIPEVFTRVFEFQEFINENTNGEAKWQ